MIHLLKIYAIKSIADNNVEIDYSLIPKDLHDFTKDFNEFLKLNIPPDIDPCGEEVGTEVFFTKFNIYKNDLLFTCLNFDCFEVFKYIHKNGGNIHWDHDRLLRDEFYISNSRPLNTRIVKYIISDIPINKKLILKNILPWTLNRNKEILEFCIDNFLTKDEFINWLMEHTSVSISYSMDRDIWRY